MPLRQSMREMVIDRARRDRLRRQRRVGAEMIGLLGHRQRHDVHRRRGDERRNRLRVLGRDHQPSQRADQRGPLAVIAALRDRVQAVLRRERVAHPRRAERHAGDRPIPIARRHRGIGVDRLVGAVERAQAEVDDADLLRVAVVGRPSHMPAQPIDRAGIEPWAGAHRR